MTKHILAIMILVMLATPFFRSSESHEPFSGTNLQLDGEVTNKKERLSIKTSIEKKMSTRDYIFGEMECRYIVRDIKIYDLFGVGTSGQSPRPCLTFLGDQYSITKTLFISNEGAAPIRIWRNLENSGPSTKNVAVFFVGGPGKGIDFEYNSTGFKFVHSTSSNFSRMIMFGYYGTNHRSAFPRPGIEAAVSEISLFLQDLRRNGWKITLIGHSFGALIASELNRKFGFRAILLMPPLLSMDGIGQHQYATRPDLKGVKPPASTAFLNNAQGYDFGAAYGTRPQRANYGEWLEVSEGKYRTESLFRIVPPAISYKYPGCVLTIMGGDDTMVYNGSVAALSPSKTIRIIPGMKHAPETPAELTAISSAIRDFSC